MRLLHGMRHRHWLIGMLLVGLGTAVVSGLFADVFIRGPVPGDPDWRPQPAAASEDGKLRIIVFGGHPDDCEFSSGGVGALWAKQGHHVKFVSMTNGDIGHWRMAGGPLAQRRTAEVKKAAEVLGIAESEVLDIHDGELMPDLPTRKMVVRLIRDWKADVVIVHRPHDYHPDHRNAGLVVRDAAYMVTVPYFCPDAPYLDRNPLFLYSYDRFERPYPFVPDVVVDIDSAIETKADALAVMESQFVEGGCCGSHIAPRNDEERAAGRETVRERFRSRAKGVAERYRDRLKELYGDEGGEKVRHAEAFEIAEHGRMPSEEEMRALFPFEGLRYRKR